MTNIKPRDIPRPFQLTNFQSPLAKGLGNYLVGFDEIFDSIEKAAAKVSEQAIGFPPRNTIRHDDDSWELQFAVAGYKRDELSVVLERSNLLTIIGEAKEKQEVGTYLHRGIGLRNFKHEITIPEDSTIKVQLVDGLLKIYINRIKKEPEHKLIEIE